MTGQTVWHDNGGVKCVDSANSPAVVHGAQKATADTDQVGEVTPRHIVTVEDGVVTGAELPPEPEPTADDWLRDIAATRYEHEGAGTTFTHSDGNTYGVATDRQSQAMVTGAKVSLDGTTDTVQWKTAQGFVTVDAADMDALAQAVRTHVQSCFDREAALIAKVEDGTITESDMEAGWP